MTPGPLPHAEAWAAEELSLPMSPALRAEEVERAAEACLAAVDGLEQSTPLGALAGDARA